MVGAIFALSCLVSTILGGIVALREPTPTLLGATAALVVATVCGPLLIRSLA